MKPSPLRDKSASFAKSIVLAARTMRENRIESVLTNQLLRAGTSVGANIHEAQFAHGGRDFVSKLEIALKECNECEYWLNLLKETDSIAEPDYKDLMTQCTELCRMLVSSVNTMKAKE